VATSKAQRFDDCRAFERRGAYAALNRALTTMSTDEREKVRNRVIYVLSSQGPEGFRTLARIHDVIFAPFGEPPDNLQAIEAQGPRWETAAPAAIDLFQRNDIDAYTYNYLAVQDGDVSAYVMLKDFERSSAQRAAYGALVEGKARRWTPPYEFYPPDAPRAACPIPTRAIRRGDANEPPWRGSTNCPSSTWPRPWPICGSSPRPVREERELQVVEVQAFQAMLGRPGTGRLSAVERVRAIQYAAVNGSSKAQLVLAVMYSEGVGVPRDYARAFHWYEEADRQGSAEAKYAISTFFSLGMAGVADQDKALAVVYQIDGALSGFKPSVGRLQQVLAQVSRGQGGNGRRDFGTRRTVLYRKGPSMSRSRPPSGWSPPDCSTLAVPRRRVSSPSRLRPRVPPRSTSQIRPCFGLLIEPNSRMAARSATQPKPCRVGYYRVRGATVRAGGNGGYGRGGRRYVAARDQLRLPPIRARSPTSPRSLYDGRGR
jgi:TPR repeat protein